MRNAVLALALFAALPALAGNELFTKYETVRQSFLKSSFAEVKVGAKQLADAARAAKQPAVAAKADAVAKSADLEKARDGFALLSDEMIKLRGATAGARPAVYYCSMVKRSWLQPKGKIGNPYDESMAMCGELKAE